MPQSLSCIFVHVVFATRHRVPILSPEIRRGLHKYLAGILRNLGCHVVEIGGVSDHVHLLIGLSRTSSMAEVIEKVKTGWSKWLKSCGEEFRGFHWQNGYAAFSVGRSQVDRVARYIVNQEEHHRRYTFQEEYRRFLEHHRVAYDERYVWE